MVSTNCIKLYFTHSIVYLFIYILFINKSFNTFLSQLKKSGFVYFILLLIDGKHV